LQYWLTRLMLMSITLIPERLTSIPSLRWLDSSILPHRPWFNSRLVHVGFVVDKVTLGQVFLQVLQVLPVSVIPHYFIKSLIHSSACQRPATVLVFALPQWLSSSFGTKWFSFMKKQVLCINLRKYSAHWDFLMITITIFWWIWPVPTAWWYHPHVRCSNYK